MCLPLRHSPHPRDPGSDQGCHYCQEPGHWKNECPTLRGRGRGFADVRPTALAASVPVCSKGVQKPDGWSGSCPSGRGGYLPFISGGFVSLVGSEVQVPVRVFIVFSHVTCAISWRAKNCWR